MNQIARTDDRTLAIESKIDRQVSSAIAVGTGGITFQNAGEVMEYAKMMAVSGSAVPKHLRGQPGACLGIIDDAIRFQTSPYALARKSYFVNDNLAYEAQVLAGIVNAHAPLKQRPQVVFKGEGADRVCIVTGDFKDGAIRDYESPKFKDIHPKNSPLWKNDPDQQQAYYSLRGFARRHCPETLLGIYDVEEMRFAEMRDVSPEQPDVLQRLKDRSAEGHAAEREGFDPAFVAQQTGASTEPSAGIPSPVDAGSGAAVLPSPAADQSQIASPAAPVVRDEATEPAGETGQPVAGSTNTVSDQESGEGGGAGAVEAGAEPQAAPAPSADPIRAKMVECLNKFLQAATDETVPDAKARQESVIFAKNVWKEEIKDHADFVKACTDAANKVVKGTLTVEAARKQLEALLP